LMHLHASPDFLRLRCFGSLGFRLLVLVLAVISDRSHSFAIFGYLPEYRFASVDWDGAMQHITHLLLFSVEPTADGDIAGIDRFWNLRQPSSPLRLALKRAGSQAPKVLLTLGGAGRSDHYPKVVADKKLRKKLARRISQLLVDYPVLGGVDFNWEAPRNKEDWLNLGKLVQEVRHQIASSPVQLGAPPVITMAYHPLSQSVEAFASLRSNKDGQSFVGYFDYCHAMAYSKFDENKRHATQKAVKLAIDEWNHFKLPPSRLTIGLPFFGFSTITHQPRTYSELIDKEPTLKTRLDVDETADNVYFNNGHTLAKKVRYVMKHKLGGVMIWELGQDKAVSDPGSGSLLRHVYTAAVEAASESGITVKPTSSGFADFLVFFSEDNLIAGIAGIIGAYLLLKSLYFHTPVRQRAPRGEDDPPSEPSAEHQKILAEYEERYQREQEQAETEEKRRAQDKENRVPESDKARDAPPQEECEKKG